MEPTIIIAAIGGIVTLIGAIIAGIFGMLQAREARKSAAETHAIVKGNGHGSVTDMVELLHQGQAEVLVKLGQIMERIDSHIGDERVHQS